VSNGERILSPYDPEARRSKKRSTQWDGYKVHLSETCDPEEAVHLIVNVQTTVATRQDVQETLSIMAQLEEHERAPQTMYLDSGYLSAAIVLVEQQHGRQLLGPVHDDRSWQQHTGYGQPTFELDWEQQQARCPQGQVSASWKETKDNRGEETIQIGFAGRICQACEVRAQCTTASRGGRTLTVYPRDIHAVLQQRRAEQSTPAFQKQYARRAGVESTMSEGVRSHGMRHSRYRGRDKTHLQMVTVAAAINLVRIESMLTRTQKGLPPRQPRAPSPFARLRDQYRSA
jgi:transposase